jgi:type VI secretion system protein ImpM
MVGAWASSGDSAGRRYPMTVATCYDYEEMLAVGPALPIAVWPFIAAAYELTANGRELPVDQFLGRVAQLTAVPLDNPELAAAAYDRWLQTQSMKMLWETTFGTVATRHSVLSMMDATLEIFRGQERPQTALALRLPLNAGDAYAAAVWMDVTRRLAKWDRTVVNAFWTPQHDLMLHIGPPQQGTFRELISCGTDAEHVTDLITASHVDEATARAHMRAPLAQAADNVDQTIHAFLHAL